MAKPENPFAVRWDTEHEEEDLSRLMGAVSDDFAIYLDRIGWQITLKSAYKPRKEDFVANVPKNDRHARVGDRYVCPQPT